MSIKDDLKRLEYLNELKSLYNGTLVRHELQANTLVEVLFGDFYALNSSSGVGRLISDLESRIDDELKPEIYDYLVNGIKRVTSLGVSHVVSGDLNILGDKAFDFIGLDQRLSLDYINRVGEDGLRLSDRIWGLSDKKAITKEVYNAVEKGLSKYQLAENLERVVTSGVPRHMVERVANTELVYAYNHAKADISRAEMGLFPNSESFVTISLSPAHKIYDICDTMVGRYRLGDSPIPPFHPNCNCSYKTELKIGGTGGKTTTLERSIHEYSNLGKSQMGVKSIETLGGTVMLPKYGDKK